jgi:hypothetical protein
VELGSCTHGIEDSLRLGHTPAAEPDEAVAARRPGLYFMWEQGRDELGLLSRGGVDRDVHAACLSDQELKR